LFQSSKTRSLSEFMSWCEFEIKALERQRSQETIFFLGLVVILGFIFYESNINIDLRHIATSIWVMFGLLYWVIRYFFLELKIDQLRLSQIRAKCDFGGNSEDWEMHRKELDIDREVNNHVYGDDRKNLILNVFGTIIYFAIMGAIYYFLSSY